MKNWVILKLNCFRRKAQALSELAIFGTILLLVFAFMLRMGMLYMHRQDINMRAFRKAMAEAIKVDRPDASATVVLVEDKHIPDPRDIVGTGDIVAIQGSASVVWGNTLPYYVPADGTHVYDTATDKDLSTMHFEINDIKKEYLIEGYGVTGSSAPNVSFAGLFNVYTQVHGWNSVNQSDLRVNNPLADEPMAVYMKDGIKDTVTKIRRIFSENTLNILYVEPQPEPNEYRVLNFHVLNRENGEINLDYLSLNNDLNEDGTPDVTQANMQGLIPGTNNLTRTDSVHLIEEPEGGKNERRSVTVQQLTGIIEHRVKTNSDKEDNFDYKGDKGVIINRTAKWKTPK